MCICFAAESHSFYVLRIILTCAYYLRKEVRTMLMHVKINRLNFIVFSSEIDLRRHIVCEVCDPKVSGGYDPELNQVIIIIIIC